jgi:ribonucleoside-triphosphate reductase
VIYKVIKRDGTEVPFEASKIEDAICKAAVACGLNDEVSRSVARDVTCKVEDQLELVRADRADIESIQDLVESSLIESGYGAVAKAYILYRQKRTDVRESRSHMMKTMFDLTFRDAVESDNQRENANIDADSSMGTMLKYGSEIAKEYYLKEIINPKFAQAHREGRIHIHDLDFFALTTTCTQINLGRLFEKGFHTGHGYIRTPNSIGSYASLACIVIQANQSDQHGGQSIPAFDYYMAPGVAKTFRTTFLEYGKLEGIVTPENIREIEETFNDRIAQGVTVLDRTTQLVIRSKVLAGDDGKEMRFVRVWLAAMEKTRKATYQAMEALIHNLNTMNSRAGAQVPFSSINYGTGTSPEQRMVTRECLRALDAGLGNGETSIFPIHIYKVKDGVNAKLGDPNYDLFQLACRVSAKRLFPNFEFLDAPFNLEFYKEGDPDTEVATMGCRTRVMANINGPSTTSGRGNLSFTTINLPRLAIEASNEANPGNGDGATAGAVYALFMHKLDDALDLVIGQLLERFEIQAERHVYNYPFLMGQGVWMDSDKLKREDTVRDVIKHGTLGIGFIGLAEAMKAIFGKNHAESKEVWDHAYKVVERIRNLSDQATKAYHLNFSVIATPAEGLSGRFVRIDRKEFGEIKGVTDRPYYTNSFHVPVYEQTGVFRKIDLEAPFHALCNGGHITYVELDGDVSKNPEAFEEIITYMRHAGIGYGSINHAVDYDPVCGYTGIINDVCPRCGRREGEGIELSRLEELRRQNGGK